MKAAGVEAPTTRPEKAASVACRSSTPYGLGVSFDTTMSDHDDMTALRFAGVLLTLSKHRPDDRPGETEVGP